MKIFNNPEQIIEAIDEMLLSTRKNGGELPIPIHIDWKGDQNDESRVLRLSAAGKCARQMAYNTHYPEEREELSARALNVFILGDLLHEMERHLINQVATLTRVEERVEMPITPTVNVAGHIDGVLELASGPVILDIKSINTRGFKEATEVGPRPDYIAQINAYMHATGIHNSVLWMYNKDTSHRAAIPITYSPAIVEEIKERFQAVLFSKPFDLPERMYSPVMEISRGKITGREYLPWQCGYCPFTERCWSEEGFEMEFDKGKPRWFRTMEESNE